MNGWDGHSSGSGAEHGPSEERGQAAWSDGGTASAPPWASAETQTGGTLPPPWAPPPPDPVHPAPPTPYGGHPTPPYTGYPTPPYTLPPAPAPRHHVGRVVGVIALIVAVGAGTGAGTWYLVREHRTDTGAGPVGVSSTSAAPTPSGSRAPSTPSDTPAAATPPASPVDSPSAGYRRAQDPVGYSIDVPQGWTRREEQGKLAPIVYYDAPADGRQLQIFRVTESTPYKSLTLAETDPGYGFAAQPGYQVVERDHGDTWAELSYRYTDADKGARQVIDHRFEAPDGTLYAIRASGPASLDPERVREPLRMAVRYFCPTGTECA
ncbi:hypothetical protein ABT065_25265 [Streptomyces sp. NPDC002764]|uniref:hypothetical protein n=1 Tax=Streptomyces sp. NPDC002764 TaxID=3154428 RepID=UPI00331EC16E